MLHPIEPVDPSSETDFLPMAPDSAIERHAIQDARDYGNGEDKAVNPIENAAMPWNEVAAIFDVKPALDGRLHDIPKL